MRDWRANAARAGWAMVGAGIALEVVAVAALLAPSGTPLAIAALLLAAVLIVASVPLCRMAR